jgi:hypothetical protein
MYVEVIKKDEVTIALPFMVLIYMKMYHYIK